MSRLLAFGCSNTYGESLPDNHHLPFNTQPSRYAWPAVLASLTERTCVNLGKGGTSNKKICYDIQNFQYEKDDLVVILWTYHNRSCILNEDKDKIIRLIHSDIGRWTAPLPAGTPQKITKLYYKMFENEYDSWYDMYCRINLAKSYLDSIDIRHHHFLTGDYQQTDLGEPVWNNVSFATIDMPLHCKKDRALDNLHPGIESHKSIANEIYANLK